MTTKQTKQFLGGDSYISPEIRTVEFKTEGPLCTSMVSSYYFLGGGGQYTDDFINDNGSF